MITITGIPEVLKNITQYQVRALKGIVDATEMSQARIVNSARSNHPYTDRTQNLTNSIQPGVVNISEEGVEAFVEARMPYASFVEFGTSRARPYPFLVPAMLAELPVFKKNMAKNLNRIKL